MGEIFRQERASDGLEFTGERFTSTVSGRIEIEHLHRYYLARHFCRGLDVLDIASGEGYGTAILAQVARSVTGVDIAHDAIAHSRLHYHRPNLTFLEGSGIAIPLPDHSVDRIVSFETIEHLFDHQSFMAELRRVLRPGGLLIISSPERDIYSPPDQGSNPHHVHELTRLEFHSLLLSNFRHVRSMGQRAFIGSAIAAEQIPALPGLAMPASPLPLVIEHRGDLHAEASNGLPRATYLLAIASDDPLPETPESLFIHTSDLDRKIYAQLDELKALKEHREAEIADIQAGFAKDHQIIAEQYRRLKWVEQERGTTRAALINTRQTLAVVEHELRQTWNALQNASQQSENIRQQLDNAHHQIAHAHLQLADAANHAQALQRERDLHLEEAGLLRMRLAIAQQQPQRSLFSSVIQKIVPSSLMVRYRNRKQIKRAYRIIKDSPLFDARWYLDTYQDLDSSKTDPVIHYILYGTREERDPGPDFSTTFYIRRYPDSISAGLTALEHYELHGRSEQRQIAPSSHAEAPVKEPEPVIAEYDIEADNASEPDEVIQPPVLTANDKRKPYVLCISGEPHTAGHFYRVVYFAEAIRAAGGRATICTIPEARDGHEMAEADIIYIWRSQWTPDTEIIFHRANGRKLPIVFDCDDLMFEPAFAEKNIIDGIRSQNYAEKDVKRLFSRVQQMMRIADFCTAPTLPMAARMHRRQKATFLIPNGFVESTWSTSRNAVRTRHVHGQTPLVRIGYAGGSRTHQKDFAQIASIVAAALKADPDRRLVLFRRGPWPAMDIEEFPDLHAMEHQIEWRELVPLENLPTEIARFDINLAPLEVGNVFCEAKSELKYFEAALVGVPTIASPTVPYRDAIRHGVTGMLADSPQEWADALDRLLNNPDARRDMARAAYHDVLWRYGPDGRTELVAGWLDQMLRPGRAAAWAFEREIKHRQAWPHPLPEIPETETVFFHDSLRDAEMTVIIPVYNYRQYILEALESVRDQTVEQLHLVVVDDCSTDDSLEVVRYWMETNAARFGRAVLLKNKTNQGLSLTRNAGFNAAETLFVLPLDADNKLMPEAAVRLYEAIKDTDAAYVYPSLQEFDDGDGIFSARDYNPAIFRPGNFIDATALIRLSAWAHIGGYKRMPLGWEDYDLWCRMAEYGWYGKHLDKILGFYRVHGESMLRTTTNKSRNQTDLINDMRSRHPWILDGISADSDEPGGLILPLPAEP
ncbi:Glycosyltransferase [Granulibacter bethesdensis]|uniref:glycosyltransferase n=1 Tax=Granulibacter bethesdensis TaxID=364410 RepID=UPI00090B9612|nr:glycosyltransferase [Granulibacter bethesdensis]APH56555.1 Glycosyltransferase [Granulibacter bethesdensis]